MNHASNTVTPAAPPAPGRGPGALPEGHPGYHDAAYRAQRAAIAEAALRYRPGEAVPYVRYSEAEHEVWRTVSAELAVGHRTHACREYLTGAGRLELPAHRAPQLGAVSDRLNTLTGFRLSPAAGLVETRSFYGSLAERRFQATQYIRHSSAPRFSPEPDMVHEVIGHAVQLANPRIADLYELLGRTVRRLQTPEAVSLVSRVFWFTFEYGLVREAGRTKVLGASLLTSFGELQHFHAAEVRPLSAAALAAQPYRIDVFQPVLFQAESFGHLEDFLGDLLTRLDDDRLPVVA
ncbi:phenylalanine 4-monooxygenase [Streptomyces flaveolus]|uniref:phenylalanine 4-monooxygenase n=1 Tax=Streptomyces flaveolus TaxID=67297 RepID=UPI0034163D42